MNNLHLSQDIGPEDDGEPQGLIRVLEAPDAIEEKLIDALTPGFQAEFDPEEAERAGAFLEDAVSEQDALDSVADQNLPLVPFQPWEE